MLVTVISSYTFRVIIVGTILLGTISGLLGCYEIIKKPGYFIREALQGTLAGVGLAFLLLVDKKIDVWVVGAFIAAVLSIFFILLAINQPLIKFERSYVFALCTFLYFVLILLTYLDNVVFIEQSSVKRIIYGQIAILGRSDYMSMLGSGAILLTMLALQWKKLKALLLDKNGVQGILLLIMLLIMGIVIGIQTTGIIFISSMMVMPAAAASQWSSNTGKRLFLSVFFSLLSGIIAIGINYFVPAFSIGPMIVICLTLIAVGGLIRPFK